MGERERECEQDGSDAGLRAALIGIKYGTWTCPPLIPTTTMQNFELCNSLSLSPFGRPVCVCVF